MTWELFFFFCIWKSMLGPIAMKKFASDLRINISKESQRHFLECLEYLKTWRHCGRYFYYFCLLLYQCHATIFLIFYYYYFFSSHTSTLSPLTRWFLTFRSLFLAFVGLSACFGFLWILAYKWDHAVSAFIHRSHLLYPFFYWWTSRMLA